MIIPQIWENKSHVPNRQPVKCVVPQVLEAKKQSKHIFPCVALAAARYIHQDTIKAVRDQITKCSSVQQRYHVIPGLVYDDSKEHRIEINGIR